VNNALGENKVAVILSGGPEENLQISESEYRITAKIKKSSLIEHIITKLKEHNFTKIYFIGRKNVVNDVFSLVQNGSKFGVNIEYLEEKTSLGTGDSLRLARGKITTNFLVVYGDTLFQNLNLDELWNEHLKRKGMSTLLLTTTPKPETKGVVKIEGSKILEFIQKPQKSDVYLGFSSIFVTQPELLEYPGHSLEEEIFPKLAEKGLLNGYLSTQKILKIRKKSDLK
jgi:NDP-sugar pyrophosphorylase family protein